MSASDNARLSDLPILFDTLAIEHLSVDKQSLIALIDECLPQTQCGLCEHPDGCLPYAAAIVIDNEPYNKCVPGGQPVTDAIAQIIEQTFTVNHADSYTDSDNQSEEIHNEGGNSLAPVIAAPSKWPIDSATKRPIEVRAIIREEDCIGCTKCIPACPVDAIVGTGKHMHTIFTDLCTGCELCIAPCPVDCIDLVVIERELTLDERLQEQEDLRLRYHTHLNRVTEQLADSSNAKPVISMVEAKLNNVASQTLDISEQQARDTIAAAKLRSKIKKLEKQLSLRANEMKQTELLTLQRELAQL